MAIIASLSSRYRLSRDETANILSDLLGVKISPGTVQAACERTSQALAPAVDELAKALPQQSRIGLDETGWKQKGERRWLWVASAPLFSLFSIHKRRGRQQLEEWGLSDFRGIATMDRWSAYSFFPVQHRQLCWAHLHRDLKGIVDREPENKKAKAILLGMKKMFRFWRKFRSGELDRSGSQNSVKPFRKSLKKWAKQEVKKKRKSKKRGLSRDLLRYWSAVFQFVDQEDVEPTNNHSERAIRPAVLWRRGSFGSRSDAGSQFVSRLLTVAATCRKQKRSLLGWLESALSARAVGLPPPSLLPV